MSKIKDPNRDVQVAITRDDLTQFLYPLRVDLAAIVRRIDDINRKLDRLAPVLSAIGRRGRNPACRL